jgi:hypothetical protein
MGDMEMEEGLMKQGDEQFDFDSGGGGGAGAGAGGAGAAGFGAGWEDDLEMMLLKGMKKKAQRCENCDDRIQPAYLSRARLGAFVDSHPVRAGGSCLRSVPWPSGSFLGLFGVLSSAPQQVTTAPPSPCRPSSAV